MNYQDKWEKIIKLGQGGQGEVYKVLDKRKINTELQLRPEIIKAIKQISDKNLSIETHNEAFETLKKNIIKITQMEDPKNYGALKILHKPEDARDNKRAFERIEIEIETMSEISHPNLLKILDFEIGQIYSSGREPTWFVSEFHPKGSLEKNAGIFTGNFDKALRAFRPLVEGVAELHKKNRVHRDIKPQNVFLDEDNNLIVGDFGLVIVKDRGQTRISGQFDNVGSRDWMPAWAMGIRIEDIKPTFDVFSLGKLLWAMVSKKPILQLWYFLKDDFYLEKSFINLI